MSHHTIPLDGAVGPLRFTRAIVELDPPSPLAVVHYAIDGAPQPNGVAIDLDKCIFIDDAELDLSAHAGAIREQILAALQDVQRATPR